MKFYKTFIVILVCVFIVGDSNEYVIGDCSIRYINNGYYHFRGGYYKIHTTPQCWTNARSICDAEGALLAIINSQSEANYLKRLMKYMNQRSSQNYMELLIGFHDLYRDGEYVTVEGENLETTGYSSWAPNELSGQNCGSMSHRGVLNEIPCSTPSIFACEVTKFKICDNVRKIRDMPIMSTCNTFGGGPGDTSGESDDSPEEQDYTPRSRGVYKPGYKGAIEEPPKNWTGATGSYEN